MWRSGGVSLALDMVTHTQTRRWRAVCLTVRTYLIRMERGETERLNGFANVWALLLTYFSTSFCFTAIYFTVIELEANATLCNLYSACAFVVDVYASMMMSNTTTACVFNLKWFLLFKYVNVDDRIGVWILRHRVAISSVFTGLHRRIFAMSFQTINIFWSNNSSVCKLFTATN